MSKSKNTLAVNAHNSVLLKNWDNAQDLVTFFFRNTPKSIENNLASLKKLAATLNTAQQKQLELCLQMNQDLALLASKFTPTQILATLEFLAHGRAIAHQFTQEDKDRKEVASVKVY